MSDEDASPYVPKNALIWSWGLVESAVQGIVTIDERGTVEYVNSAACTLFGYEQDELLGKNINMLMPSPYATEHDSYLTNYLTTGVHKVIGIGREVVGLRKDRSTFPMHLSISEVDIDGERRFTGLIHDITEQIASQLEKDHLLQALNWRNKELNCLYQIGELLRSSLLNERVQHDIVQILDATLGQADFTGVRLSLDEKTIASSNFQTTPWVAEAEIHVQDRKRGTLEIASIRKQSTEPDGDGNRSLLEAIARLLSEALSHQEAEAQVVYASKLASIGELAAGMGHEINNPVNGIINCADILLKQAEVGSKTAEFAELIRSEAERIAKIIRDLLTFSRQDTMQFSAANMGDIVESVLRLSGKNLEKSHILLEVDIPDALPRLECRSEQLQQVIMNLVINATHALDEKYPGEDVNKVLSIRARERRENGVDLIRLSVTDHGTGISSTHIERIYDPFFTTKGRDIGTGLGLSVSDGIIKNHKGTISVETQVNEFTAFHVDLPVYLNQDA